MRKRGLSQNSNFATHLCSWLLVISYSVEFVVSCLSSLSNGVPVNSSAICEHHSKRFFSNTFTHAQHFFYPSSTFIIHNIETEDSNVESGRLEYWNRHKGMLKQAVASCRSEPAATVPTPSSTSMVALSRHMHRRGSTVMSHGAAKLAMRRKYRLGLINIIILLKNWLKKNENYT